MRQECKPFSNKPVRWATYDIRNAGKKLRETIHCVCVLFLNNQLKHHNLIAYPAAVFCVRLLLLYKTKIDAQMQKAKTIFCLNE